MPRGSNSSSPAPTDRSARRSRASASASTSGRVRSFRPCTPRSRRSSVRRRARRRPRPESLETGGPMAARDKALDGGAGKAKREKLSRKEYEKRLAKLHVELVKAQEWIKEKGLKVCIVFEGRDGAGKGGVIKAITERVSPRVYR